MTTTIPRRNVLGFVLLAGLTTALVVLIQRTEPEATQESAVKRTAMLVEVTQPERGSFEPMLTALGAVRAVQDVVLQPQVSGQVASVAEGFVPGMVVPADTPLITLQTADARNVVAQRRSSLMQAEAALRLERGRQAVARTERDQIAGEISTEQEALILREPQLQAAEATHTAARAMLGQAELDLARTTITAPFRSLVLERRAHVGSQVGPGDALGRVVDVSRFWVEVTLPVSQLRHLALVDGQATGTPVQIFDRAAWPEGVSREGRLHSVVRQLDDATRQARLLVAVDDPLGLDSDAPALVVGAWVQAQVAAAPLEDVVRIERTLLRRGNTVWEMVDGALVIREVDVILQDATYAYLAGGLSPDAAVVVTNLATVSEGASLRTESP